MRLIISNAIYCCVLILHTFQLYEWNYELQGKNKIFKKLEKLTMNIQYLQIQQAQLFVVHTIILLQSTLIFLRIIQLVQSHYKTQFFPAKIYYNETVKNMPNSITYL